jgi:phosphoribosyl 1,2-cyclic phosphodiesterase
LEFIRIKVKNAFQNRDSVPELNTVGYYFRILGSSSSGNCSLLKTENSTILIDAGFSGKRICEMLEDAGECIENVDAVFITHEHSDHATGVKGLSRHTNLKFYANRDTAQAIQEKLNRRVNWQLFDTGRAFTFRDLKVSPFSIPHDAYDPVAFVFAWGEQDLFNPARKLAWLTDLGYVPKLVKQKIHDVDYLVIEANHDVQMLEMDVRRPWSLKQRILGRHGHLSNKATLTLLQEVDKPSWRKVFLAHLSRDCNNVDLVRRTFHPMERSHNCSITVVDPENPVGLEVSG